MKLIRYHNFIPAPLERTTNRDKDMSDNLKHNTGLSNGLKSPENLLLRNILLTCLISYLIIGCATSLPQSVQGWKLKKDDKGTTTFGGGSLTRFNDFFILHLSGTPYEMGYQQGVLLKDDIRKFTDDSWEYIDTDYLKGYLFFVKWFAHCKARSIAKEYLPYIPQEYIDEMRGIADGSGVAFNNVLLANSFIEAAAQVGKRFLCTSLVLNGSNTFDNSLVHAYNTDTYLPLKGRNYIDRYKGITFYHPEKGNSFVSVTSCGFNSVFTGMNDKGIAVSFVCPMKSAVDYGMPVRYLIRRILEKADNLAEAQGMVKSVQRTIEGDITISDGKNNQAATIAFSPPQPPDKITWTEKIEELIMPKADPDTVCRGKSLMVIGRGENEMDSIIKHHTKKEQFDIKDIARILRYEPWDNHGICSAETSFSMIYHPSSLRFWVALGDTPTPANTYYGFDIKGNRLTEHEVTAEGQNPKGEAHSEPEGTAVSDASKGKTLSEDNPQFPSIIPPLPREPQIKEFVNSVSFKPVTITLGTALTQTLLITPKNPFNEAIIVDICIEPVSSSGWTCPDSPDRMTSRAFAEGFAQAGRAGTHKQIMLEPGKNKEVSFLISFDGQNPFPIPETMIEYSIGGEKMFRHYDNLPYTLQNRVLHIKKATSNINIDGKLDEESWGKTESAGKWINTSVPDGTTSHDGLSKWLQRDPDRLCREGQQSRRGGTDWASKDTDWSVCYDNDFLYLAFNCREDEMDKMKQTITARDWETLTDDSVVFYLDPNRDDKSYFCFGVTAFGVTMEYKASEGKKNRSWNPEWNINVQKDERGYIIEAAIPFKSLECKSPSCPVKSADSEGNELRQRSISNTLDTSNGVKMLQCLATAAGTEWMINAFRMRTPIHPPPPKADKSGLTVLRRSGKPELSGWNPPVKELSNPAGFGKAVFE